MQTSRILTCILLFAAALPATSQEPLSVLTYNIRNANPRDGQDIWANRAEAVSEFVAQHDVIGLQEVTLAQLNHLTESLPAFDHYGVGRDDGKSGGEHAPIFYRRDRLEALSQGTFWLSEQPNKAGSKGWDAALPRTCTWITFKDKQTNQAYWIANTHFDHRGSTARSQSGQLILQKVVDSAEKLPVVVMGDFNCLPASEPYQALIAGGVLVDARKVSESSVGGPNGTWNGFRKIEAGRVIDHLFVRGVSVLELETMDPKTTAGRFASDHLPVRMLVRVPASADTNTQ